MQNFHLETHIGADGILRLSLPVAVKNMDMQVVVMCQPLSKQSSDAADFSKLWAALSEFPDDFMEPGREQPVMQERESIF